MLETLLNHFRSYGMEDLAFIIVNSKLSHSQDKLQELEKRVSFKVYQETDEEEVWSVMEGGKDDMYIYDRCGRLTYYIPFPLSILDESPLVSNAILATYFRSPCGSTCDQNKTLEVEDIVKNIEGDESDLETINTTTQDYSTYGVTELQISINETTSNETQHSNNLFDLTLTENEIEDLNLNSTGNMSFYDYPTYDNGLHVNETNSTNVDKAKSYFSNIYRLFFTHGQKDDKLTDTEAKLNGTSLTDETNQLSSNTTEDAKKDVTGSHAPHLKHDHHSHDHSEKRSHGKKKSDRCLEADYEVCKSWSKKRLLHAQKCCSDIHTDPDSHDHRSCDNFGKKRCKKMQPILKCCIKTVYIEPVAGRTSEDEAKTLPPVGETVIVRPIEEPTVTTQIPDVTCCKEVNGAKMCRVAFSGACDEGEHAENSPSLP